VSKKPTGKPPGTERIWEGAGLGLDRPILYPVLSENPAGLLRAIAELRPPGNDPPPARRGPGRPPWPRAKLLQHLHEARVKAAPSDRLADIAAEFRDLRGEIGVTPDYLRRLLRRTNRPSEIPE
jgi:hypothetical protein